MHQPQPQQRQQLAPPAQAAASQHSNSNAWFQGAPATKILLAFTVLLHVFLHKNSTPATAQQRLSFRQLPSHKDNDTYYRYYFSSKLTFATTGELVVGTALLVFLGRKYERELGTRRFLAFLVYAGLFAVVQEALLRQWLLVYANRVLDTRSTPLRWRYAGPYFAVGALFCVFHATAPRLHPRFVSLLGISLFGKVLLLLVVSTLGRVGRLAHGTGGADGMGRRLGVPARAVAAGVAAGARGGGAGGATRLGSTGFGGYCSGGGSRTTGRPGRCAGRGAAAAAAARPAAQQRQQQQQQHAGATTNNYYPIPPHPIPPPLSSSPTWGFRGRASSRRSACRTTMWSTRRTGC